MQLPFVKIDLMILLPRKRVRSRICSSSLAARSESPKTIAKWHTEFLVYLGFVAQRILWHGAKVRRYMNRKLYNYPCHFFKVNIKFDNLSFDGERNFI